MLRIVGDINLTDGYFDLGFGVGSMLKTKQYDPFCHLSRDNKDIWIGNFEGVASETSKLNGTKAEQFRIAPEALSHLKHFNYYGVANNHVMQHGDKAYFRTIEYLESQDAKCFGSDKVRTQFFEHQGKLVSITGFCTRIDAFSFHPLYWYNPEYLSIVKEIKNISSTYFKIAYVHWGNEFINYPSSQQKKFAHWLIDAGFDMIIGMHPHILQGYEVYEGKHIFYSIGNFVFDMAWEPTHYGAMVNVDLSRGVVKVGLEYVKIGEDFAPQVVDKKDVPEDYRFEKLNQLLAIDENSEEYHAAINRYYKQYRKANHKDIFKKMTGHPSVAFGVIKDYIERRF